MLWNRETQRGSVIYSFSVSLPATKVQSCAANAERSNKEADSVVPG